LWRGVISPQNGHILGDPASWSFGLSVAGNWANQTAIEVTLLQNRMRNRRTFISIDLTWTMPAENAYDL